MFVSLLTIRGTNDVKAGLLPEPIERDSPNLGIISWTRLLTTMRLFGSFVVVVLQQWSPARRRICPQTLADICTLHDGRGLHFSEVNFPFFPGV